MALLLARGRLHPRLSVAQQRQGAHGRGGPAGSRGDRPWIEDPLHRTPSLAERASGGREPAEASRRSPTHDAGVRRPRGSPIIDGRERRIDGGIAGGSAVNGSERRHEPPLDRRCDSDGSLVGSLIGSLIGSLVGSLVGSPVASLVGSADGLVDRQASQQAERQRLRATLSCTGSGPLATSRGWANFGRSAGSRQDPAGCQPVNLRVNLQDSSQVTPQAAPQVTPQVTLQDHPQVTQQDHPQVPRQVTRQNG